MTEPSLQKRIGYSEKVIDHFRRPRNIGAMKDADVTAKVGSVACGDLVKIYLKVDGVERKIKDISFESYGCAANIATASMMTEMVKGKSLDEAKKLTFTDIANELGGLPKVKMHCSVLTKTGLDTAILKYEVNSGVRKFDDLVVRRILRSVLDPVTGEDIFSAKMVDDVKVVEGEVLINLSVQGGGQLANTLKEDISEAFEGLNFRINIMFKESHE